jgi:hypothetical protein
MNKDISDILKAWPATDDDQSARKIVGDDGVEQLQLRLDLGVLQMFFDGRPDGERPFGQNSLLDHLLRLTESQPEAKIDAEMWSELDREVMQFYHRRRALLILGSRTQTDGRDSEAVGYYERAVRDANHNLAIMDFITAHSSDDEYVQGHERYRPFVLMHRTLAEAQMDLIHEDIDEAIERLKAGQSAIETHHREYGEAEVGEQDPALAHLRALEQQIRRQHHIDKTLREQLTAAVEMEQFELAARLRDQLRKKQTEAPPAEDLPDANE